MRKLILVLILGLWPLAARGDDATQLSTPPALNLLQPAGQSLQGSSASDSGLTAPVNDLQAQGAQTKDLLVGEGDGQRREISPPTARSSHRWWLWLIAAVGLIVTAAPGYWWRRRLAI